jgi:hypothetical protein
MHCKWQETYAKLEQMVSKVPKHFWCSERNRLVLEEFISLSTF